MADANARYFYHFDGLGSVVALSDVNSAPVERYAYDVFGRPTIRDANGVEIAASAFANPYLFTGRAYDAETALYYYRARYYDYFTARFLQPDPIGYVDGLNLYAYVRNNPVARIDSLGLHINPPVGDSAAAFGPATKHLAQSPAFVQAYNNVATSPYTHKVVVDSRITEGAYHDPTGQINWNPYKALLTSDFQVQSPVMVLAHELAGHAANDDSNGDLPLNRDETGDAYGNVEDRNVITGIERAIALDLGEPVRTDHRGFYFDVNGPTDRPAEVGTAARVIHALVNLLLDALVPADNRKSCPKR